MIQWINNPTGSTNQYVTPGLIGDNEFQALVNASQLQLGDVGHRLGSDLYLDRISASNPVRGLHMFQKVDGTNYLHAVHQGSLYVGGASNWSSQAASQWSTSSEIDMVNFIGRHYMASSTAGEFLKYGTETGALTTPTVYSATASTSSTSTTLVTTTDFFSSYMVGHTIYNLTDGTSAVIAAYTNTTTVTLDTTINDTWDSDTVAIKFDPKYLAVNGPYMVGVNTSAFPRRCYWSDVDSGTFTMSTNFFIASAPPTGVAAFGNGRPFVVFTNNSYMVIDPGQVTSNEVSGFGCVSHRSIKEVRGNLIYLGRDAFNAISANSSYPTDMARKIRNDHTADAFFNKIAPANLGITASGKKNDIYFCAVRNLSAAVRGQTLNSAIFVLDTSQNTWKVDTYTDNDLASVMAEFTDSTGETNLYGGSYSAGAVYKMYVPGLYTDDDSTGATHDVTTTMRWKPFQFLDKGSPHKKKNIKALHFVYKAANAITVKVSVDGNTTFSTLRTLPAYTTTDWRWKVLPYGEELKSLAIETSTTGDFHIYAIGFEYDVLADTGLSGG